MIRGYKSLVISSAFPFYADRKPWYKKHAGVDIMCETGAELEFFADSEITGLFRLGVHGIPGANYVRFRPRDSDHEFVFKHCKPAKGIEKGGRVRAGDLAGVSDNSGVFHGGHLHYECRTVGNVAIEPIQQTDKFAKFKWQIQPGEWHDSIRNIFALHHPETLKIIERKK